MTRRVKRIYVIDSHTGGEPTRVVVAGGPDLGAGPLSDRRRIFAEKHDAFRRVVANEPRGSDILVGALIVPPAEAECAAGVIYFNNVGVLNMCGHGTIGLAVTLGRLGQIKAGTHRIDTPVGVVSIEYDGEHGAAFENVPSYRHAKDVSVELPGYGKVTGDIAWGGNWFFLVGEHKESLELENVERLTDVTWRIRQALEAARITGRDGAQIDHIELFGPPNNPQNHSRNFVLCPGKAYDRSPCGTGTCAKLACLHADGKLRQGQIWRQESILGSVFEGSVRAGENEVLIPRISGEAYITAEATLLVDSEDPLAPADRP